MYRTKIKVVLSVVWIVLSLSACHREQPFSQTFLQFGTLINVTLYTSSPHLAMDAFAQIDSYLSKRHTDWHSWLEGDLYHFNQALAHNPGQWVDIPPSLTLLIDQSQHYFQRSNGRFNPALGKLVAAWGFHQNSQPDTALISTIQQSIPRMDQLIINAGRAKSENPHLQLDFGGIAKGLAVAEIRSLLEENNIHNFIVNAGGDLTTSGHKPGQPWRIAIENPFKEGIIATLELSGQHAVFTSGNYRRQFKDKGQPMRHHIIDPLSGQPSKFISSATVLHDDPVRADAAATALMLTQPQNLSTVATRMGVHDFLVITNNGDVLYSPSFVDQLQWAEGNQLNRHQINTSGIHPNPE